MKTGIAKPNLPIYILASLLCFFIAFPAISNTASLSVQPNKVERKEVSRKQAIEIARGQINFLPKNISAVRLNTNGRHIWRITFRGKKISRDNPIGEIVIVDIDRLNGEIISVAKS